MFRNRPIEAYLSILTEYFDSVRDEIDLHFESELQTIIGNSCRVAQLNST